MNDAHLQETHRKIVLCVPRWCGLNDTLVQIWLAYQYALDHGRRLIIDTRVCGFWDDLDNYFIPTSETENGSVPISMRVTDEDTAFLNGLETYPRRYQGRVDFMQREIHLRAVVAHKRHKLQRSMTFVTRALVSGTASRVGNGFIRRFDFLLFVGLARLGTPRHPLSRPTHEDLVVQHLSGGGSESLNALKLFTLTAALRSAVHEALAICGNDYDAIHIRNTDMQSEYEDLFEEARRRLSGRRVLVCSDDSEAIAAAREQLSESVVFTVTTTEATKGSPLHKLGSARTAEERRLLNFNVIVDLICLSQSRELLIAKPRSGSMSGFSALARALHSRSDIVDHLLGS